MQVNGVFMRAETVVVVFQMLDAWHADTRTFTHPQVADADGTINMSIHMSIRRPVHRSIRQVYTLAYRPCAHTCAYIAAGADADGAPPGARANHEPSAVVPARRRVLGRCGRAS